MGIRFAPVSTGTESTGVNAPFVQLVLAALKMGDHATAESLMGPVGDLVPLFRHKGLVQKLLQLADPRVTDAAWANAQGCKALDAAVAGTNAANVAQAILAGIRSVEPAGTVAETVTAPRRAVAK